MKGKFLILLLLLWGAVELSAQTIVQQFTAISQGTTTSDMDLQQPTAKGSVLIAMPALLTPGLKVLSVTDNAEGGGNTYKQVPGSSSSCAKKDVGIWYCENCNPGATEVKFHISGDSRGSINAFVELSDMAFSMVADGGAHVTDGTANSSGVEVGPSLTTTGKDFIVGRFFPTAPLPSGVSPAGWNYNPSYIYMLDAQPGTYQPSLTGGKPGNGFCLGLAAFKTGSPANPQTK